MNLSTARSEKRAKEVGIRKAIGSERRQLVVQFFSESVITSGCAFILSLLLVLLILPFFNAVADKKIALLWSSPVFWLTGIGFAIITGLIAGVYPALFLSSFQPVKVLKGTFRVGRSASLPRKVLVVMQFSISIILIIGTMVVYKQINHAQGRSIGYSKDGLISINSSDDTHNHFASLRAELKNSGAVAEITESGSPITDVWNSNGGFEWEGKDPNLAVDFPNNSVTYEYGKTIGWKIAEGRDFSRDFATDSLAFILNESAVKFIGLKDPIGKTIRWEGKPFTVIGVVKDMLVQSPYLPVRPSLFHLSTERQNVFIVKLHPTANVSNALSKIEAIFKKYDPATPFSATFTDQEFAKKFGSAHQPALYILCRTRYFNFMFRFIRACLFCSRTANQRNWYPQSAGSNSINAMANAVERLCVFSSYFVPDSRTNCVVFYDAVVAEVRLSHGNTLVGFCNSMCFSIVYYFTNSKLPGNKSGNSKPGKKFTDGVSPGPKGRREKAPTLKGEESFY
jgi:hypothetical protein